MDGLSNSQSYGFQQGQEDMAMSQLVHMPLRLVIHRQSARSQGKGETNADAVMTLMNDLTARTDVWGIEIPGKDAGHSVLLCGQDYIGLASGIFHPSKILRTLTHRTTTDVLERARGSKLKNISQKWSDICVRN